MATRQLARTAATAAPSFKKPEKKVAPAPQVKPAAPTPAPQAPTQPPAQPALASPAPVKPVTQDTKVVRDGFTMPQADYDLLKSLKAQCLKAGVDVKKSELLRAGVQALAALSMADLATRLTALSPVKAGRRKSKD